jgi:hypothetical protein
MANILEYQRVFYFLESLPQRITEALPGQNLTSHRNVVEEAPYIVENTKIYIEERSLAVKFDRRIIRKHNNKKKEKKCHVCDTKIISLKIALKTPKLNKEKTSKSQCD